MPSSAARSASAQPARRAASICSGVIASSSSIAAAAGCHSSVTIAGPGVDRQVLQRDRRCGDRGRGRRPGRRRASRSGARPGSRAWAAGSGCACTPAMKTTASASMPSAVIVGAPTPMIDGGEPVPGRDGRDVVGQRQNHPGRMSALDDRSARRRSGRPWAARRSGYLRRAAKARLWPARRCRRNETALQPTSCSQPRVGAARDRRASAATSRPYPGVIWCAR